MADSTDLDVTDKPDLGTTGIETTSRSALGWMLFIALIVAVSIAISMAVQLDTSPEVPRRTPPCGGLYSDCCEDWDDNWGPCAPDCDDVPVERDGRGLFDAEDEFAERRVPPGC